MLIKNEFPAIPIIEQIHITSMHSLFKIHYECGFEFPGETHDFWECLYILDGELCVSADERIYNMSQGELIFHKPLEFHKFIVNNPKWSYRAYFFFFGRWSITFWLRNKVFNFSGADTIIDSLLVYMQNKVDLINIETEKNRVLLFTSFFQISILFSNYCKLPLPIIFESRGAGNIILCFFCSGCDHVS